MTDAIYSQYHVVAVGSFQQVSILTDLLPAQAWWPLCTAAWTQ